MDNKKIINSLNSDIRLVKINQGEFFGFNCLSNPYTKDSKYRTETAVCEDETARVYRIKKVIFEILYSENQSLRDNFVSHKQKI